MTFCKLTSRCNVIEVRTSKQYTVVVLVPKTDAVWGLQLRKASGLRRVARGGGGLTSLYMGTGTCRNLGYVFHTIRSRNLSTILV